MTIKYSGQTYLRSEHLLKNGKYVAAKVTVKDIVTDCPLQKKNGVVLATGLAFEKTDKVLGLCPTNFSQMCWATGEGKEEAWVGKKITLVVRLIKSPKGLIPGIRVWPDKPNPRPQVTDHMGMEITDEWYERIAKSDPKAD
jgi:hypothetical protein